MKLKAVRTPLPPLTAIHDAPECLRTNPFILHAYRQKLTPLECVVSIFSFHNETISIWTALLPAVLFAYLFVYHVFLDAGAALRDCQGFTSFAVFIVAVFLAFMFSTTAHLFSPVSPTVKYLLFKLDYAGIWISSGASGMAHLALANHGLDPDTAQMLSWTVAVACVSSMVLTMHPRFKSNVYVPLRAACFAVVLVIANWAAVAHLMNECGSEWQWSQLLSSLSLNQDAVHHRCDALDLLPYSYSIVFVTGGMFYVLLVPERLAPGWFDVWGHGHQIMHVLFIVANYAQYMFVLHNMEQSCDVAQAKA